MVQPVEHGIDQSDGIMAVVYGIHRASAVGDETGRTLDEGEVLTIDADGLDFQNNPEDFATITDKIDARLFGLF